MRVPLIFLLLCLARAAYAETPSDCPILEAPPGAGQQRTNRPASLVGALPEGALRTRLERCLDARPEPGARTIGHRGAPWRYPEHTRESYLAAAHLGAGILECDVTSTRDGHLVCRHDACDLHRTTNVLSTPLASRCRIPFQPAGGDGTPASARCCTADFDLAELKTLLGRRDAVDLRATSVAAYLSAQPPRAPPSCAETGTLLSHRESISLFQALGVGMAPELKDLPPGSEVTSTDSLSRAASLSRADTLPQAELLALADQLVNDYRDAEVPPETVWLQSFNPDVVRHWLETAGEYAERVVWLDGRYAMAGFDHRSPEAHAVFQTLREAGLRTLAPPVWMLVEAGAAGPTPSTYARAAAQAGLRLVTWTLERSGPLVDGGGWYYQTLNGRNPHPESPGTYRVSQDADQLRLLALLYEDLGVTGVFTDWAETTALVDRCSLVDR